MFDSLKITFVEWDLIPEGDLGAGGVSHAHRANNSRRDLQVVVYSQHPERY